MPVAKNWSESYSQKHNWPYGADVTRDVWQDLFAGSKIIDAELPIWNTLRGNQFEENQLYVLFDSNIGFDSLDRSALLDFVNAGNSAFISTNSLDSKIFDTLHITTGYTEVDFSSYVNGINVSTFDHDFFERRDSNYTFTIRRNNRYFKSIDTIRNEMIAIAYADNTTELAFVKIPFGDGYFYLHNQPLLLTNYYIISDEGKRYVERLCSYLPSYDIIWDTHYKAVNQLQSRSPLNVVLSHASLKWAYWLTILGIVLLFLFRTKRRQRIIPIVSPPTNDSVEFTKTMGSLYYNTASNKTLALKKISVLKEYLSSQFYLKDISFNDEEVKVIVNKTDISKDEVERLFKMIDNVNSAQEISVAQLKVLNKGVNRLMGKSQKN